MTDKVVKDGKEYEVGKLYYFDINHVGHLRGLDGRNFKYQYFSNILYTHEPPLEIGAELGKITTAPLDLEPDNWYENDNGEVKYWNGAYFYADKANAEADAYRYSIKVFNPLYKMERAK